MSEIATRESSINVPLKIPQKVSIKEITISQETYLAVKKGLYREELGNRLFIFFEDNWLFVHRMIGGICACKAEIKERNREYYVDEIFIEGDNEKPFHHLFDNEKRCRGDFLHILVKLSREWGN